MTGPIHVLVVEDLDVLRDHFCSMIEQEPDMMLMGYASSGKEAIQIVKKASPLPDVILMDIEMDIKHDGIITAQKILEQYPQIRIVFLTVHEDDETVFNAFETGAVDYILKTNPSQSILSSIRSAHEGVSRIRPEIAFKIKNEFARIRKNQANLFEATYILSQLTPSEIIILDLLLKEMKINEIAKHRQVEVSTIKSQINVLLKKFKKNRTKEVISMLRQLNVTPLVHKVKNSGDSD